MAGQQWEVVNQDLRFNNGLLKFVPTSTGRRLLALVNKIPHYSDDDGKTWIASSGIPIGDRWMSTKNAMVLNDSLNTIYITSKPDYWTDISLYKSTDKGETFQRVFNFRTSDYKDFALCNPHFTNDLYYIKKENKSFQLSKFDIDFDTLQFLSFGNHLDFDESRANIAGVKIGEDSVRLVVYAGVSNSPTCYYTENLGEDWVIEGVIEEGPWEVGIYILPSNPVVMFTGGLHCLISRFKGRWWIKPNDWWDYYDDPDRYLHADMMAFNEFTTKDGTPFQLVSHHGGLSISWNEGISFKNLSLDGLNVSQYYSVRTDPTDPYFIYGGSQDQGFQRANTALSPNEADFEQIISGDYGHIVFTQSGSRLWTVYPGGSVTVYPAPKSTDRRFGWDLESEDESVWIPPLMPSPDQSENSVYLAGGNMNGGNGSHLIKLTGVLNNIVADQLPFDFKDASGGEVSAITYSPANSNQWYAATTNGRFFASENSGQTWKQSITFIPDGHYLYGQAIEASNKDPNMVFLGGSGYSNPACYLSTDGGQNFIDMVEGLPNTMIFDFAFNEDESLLFAATEAGPYVLILEEEQWYYLGGLDAPVQTYWSVEYVPFSNTARFGTYGRGIWDFNIQNVTSTHDKTFAKGDLKIYPNPTNKGKVFLSISEKMIGSYQLKISSIDGKVIQQNEINLSNNPFEISTKNMIPGNYFLTLSGEKGIISEQLIISN